jgi:hypothetical protein
MIDDPNPADWKGLQAGVCRLLNEIGLSAETEKTLTTPRGKSRSMFMRSMKLRLTRSNTSSNARTGFQPSRRLWCDVFGKLTGTGYRIAHMRSLHTGMEFTTQSAHIQRPGLY